MILRQLRPVFALLAGVALAVLVGEFLLSQMPGFIDNPPGQFQRSSTRAFQHKPHFKGKDRFNNPILINAFGMRDREYTLEKPPGVYRVLILGDSVAFGDGVKSEDTFSKQLENILNAKKVFPAGVEVLNTGTRGYNTYQELQLLKEVGIKFQPDLVMLIYVNNDAEPLEKQAGLIDKKHQWLIHLKDFVKEHSYLYAFFRKNLEVTRHLVTPQKFTEKYTDQFNPENPGWKASYESLREIKSISQANHIKFLLVLYPQLEGLKTGDTYPAAFQKIHDQLLAAGRELEIDTMDLLPELKGHDPDKLKIAPGDTFHPNPYGHRLIADILARYLEVNYLNRQVH